MAKFSEAAQLNIMDGYDISDQLLYASQLKINELEKQNQEKIKNDLFDLQIDKTRLKTELEILDKKIRLVSQKYNA